jgi:hypothetical protein
MTIAYLSLILFLALLAWRLGFIGLRPRPLVRRIGPGGQVNSITDPGLTFLCRSDTGEVVYNRFQNVWTGVSSGGSKKERAEEYLLRIVALTGAVPVGNGYVLDVGATRFHVREGRVGQLRDLNDPECQYRETCFYLVNKDMPKAERVGTALLQLAKNPSLFEQWAVQDGLKIKADGQVFTRVE